MNAGNVAGTGSLRVGLQRISNRAESGLLQQNARSRSVKGFVNPTRASEFSLHSRNYWLLSASAKVYSEAEEGSAKQGQCPSGWLRNGRNILDNAISGKEGDSRRNAAVCEYPFFIASAAVEMGSAENESAGAC